MPRHIFECNPHDEVTTPRGMTPMLHCLEKGAGSKYNWTSGLSPCEQIQTPAEFQPHHKTRPDSPVPTLHRPCDRSQKWRGTLRFPPHLRMRPYSSLHRWARNPKVALATLQVDRQLERNPKLPSPTPRKRRNSCLPT